MIFSFYRKNELMRRVFNYFIYLFKNGHCLTFVNRKMKVKADNIERTAQKFIKVHFMWSFVQVQCVTTYLLADCIFYHLFRLRSHLFTFYYPWHCSNLELQLPIKKQSSFKFVAVCMQIVTAMMMALQMVQQMRSKISREKSHHAVCTATSDWLVSVLQNLWVFH